MSLIFTAFVGPENAAILKWPSHLAELMEAKAKVEPPRFHSADRSVSNWRREAFWNLSFPPESMTVVPRCVRLNNYWCIKRAGWNGEIASDAEGHVAFASALEGATVAAMLLRRYYVDYGRHSADAIVSHWAPAQCGAPLVSVHDLAPRGLQNTLRARWLATHTRGGFAKSGKAVRLRRSIVADRQIKMMPAPEIAVGMGERDIKLKPFAYASLGTSAFASGRLTSSPSPSSMALSCAEDAPRLAAYAARVIAGVAASSGDDLNLFAEDGTPAPNLARVMRNMAAVEIGPLSARGGLIDAGIEAAIAQRAAQEKAKSDPAEASQRWRLPD